MFWYVYRVFWYVCFDMCFDMYVLICIPFVHVPDAIARVHRLSGIHVYWWFLHYLFWKYTRIEMFSWMCRECFDKYPSFLCIICKGTCVCIERFVYICIDYSLLFCSQKCYVCCCFVYVWIDSFFANAYVCIEGFVYICIDSFFKEYTYIEFFWWICRECFDMYPLSTSLIWSHLFVNGILCVHMYWLFFIVLYAYVSFCYCCVRICIVFLFAHAYIYIDCHVYICIDSFFKKYTYIEFVWWMCWGIFRRSV